MVYVGVDRPSLQNSSVVPGPAASRPLPAGARRHFAPLAYGCLLPLSNRCSKPSLVFARGPRAGHVLVRRHVSGFAPDPEESRAQNWRVGPADTASGPAAWVVRAGLPVSEPASASGYWSVGEPT